MADSAYSDMIIFVGIGKVLNMLKNLIINRSPLDLELLILRWSTESHMFVAAWGEFGRTLEDIVVLTGLLMLGESRAIIMPGSSDVALDAEGEVRLVLLNQALSESKHKGKST